MDKVEAWAEAWTQCVNRLSQFSFHLNRTPAPKFDVVRRRASGVGMAYEADRADGLSGVLAGGDQVGNASNRR